LGSIVSLTLIWLSTKLFLPNFAITMSVIALLCGSLVTAIFSIVLSRRYINWKILTNTKLALTFFKSSIPLGLTLVFNLIYFRADSFIMTVTRSTQEVGIYGFAYKIFEFPLVIPTFFMNSVYPLMINKENLQLKKIIYKSGAFLLPVSLILFGLIWVFAPFISLVKSDFIGSITALRILAGGLPFFFLSSLTMWSLISLKKQKSLFVVYLFSMIINIVLNLIYIPRFGYIAASYITVVSEFIVLVLSSFLLYKSKIFVK
jgi:O-antigen/teichoic acid export membrane protein